MLLYTVGTVPSFRHLGANEVFSLLEIVANDGAKLSA